MKLKKEKKGEDKKKGKKRTCCFWLREQTVKREADDSFLCYSNPNGLSEHWQEKRAQGLEFLKSLSATSCTCQSSGNQDGEGTGKRRSALLCWVTTVPQRANKAG